MSMSPSNCGRGSALEHSSNSQAPGPGGIRKVEWKPSPKTGLKTNSDPPHRRHKELSHTSSWCFARDQGQGRMEAAASICPSGHPSSAGDETKSNN